MTEYVENIQRLLIYIDCYYRSSSNIAPEITDDFIQFLIEKLDVYNINKQPNELIIIIKKILQYLFYSNLVVLKSKSSSSIRHYLPKELRKYGTKEFVPSKITNESLKIIVEKEKSLQFGLKIFYNSLKYIFFHPDIKITIHVPEEGPDYFYVNDYSGIIKLLLFWDNSNRFIEKKGANRSKTIAFRHFQFPNDKIEDFQEIFNKYDAFIYFQKKYVDKIFGDSGIVKKNKISIPKFIESLGFVKKYSRQTVYGWIKKNYFPITFLIDLINSKYEFDKNFYTYIKHLQIGKSKDEIKKDLLDEIKNVYEEWFHKFIQSPPNSNLGFIFSYKPITEEKQFDIFGDYQNFLSKRPPKALEKYKAKITKIKDSLKSPSSPIQIKRVELTNFKSHSHSILDFNNRINIIYGLNGSGKSTILEAILFALYKVYTFRENYSVFFKDFYSLDFYRTETNLIKAGENYSKVELLLKIGDEEVKIIRELWKDGRQKIVLDGEEIYENVRSRVSNLLEQDIKSGFLPYYEYKTKIDESEILKEFLDLLNSENLEVEFMHYLHNFDLREIHFKNKSIYNEKSKYYTRFVKTDPLRLRFLSEPINNIHKEIKNEYEKRGFFFHKNDIYSSLFREVEDIISERDSFQFFYHRKFKILASLNNQISKNNDAITNVEKERKQTLLNFLDYNTVSDRIHDINIDDFEFVLTSEDCKNCGREIFAIYSNEYMAAKCSNCGKIFCDDCLHRTSHDAFNCNKCGSELNLGSFERRIIPINDFFELLRLGRNSRKDLNVQYFIDSIKENRINYDSFKIGVKKYIFERLIFCIENPYFNAIYKIFKEIVNLSIDDKKILDFNEINSLVNIKAITKYNQNSKSYHSINLISLFCLVILLRMLTLVNSVSEKQFILKIKELKIIIDEIFNEKIPFEEVINALFPFEKKLINILAVFDSVMRSDIIFPKSYSKVSIDSKYLSYLDSYLLKFIPEMSTFARARPEKMIGVEFKGYFVDSDIALEDLANVLELDYKVFISLLRNQLKILEEIDEYPEKLKNYNSKIKKLKELNSFLKENYDFLFKKYIEDINSEFIPLSYETFRNKNFSCFVDENGEPKIKYLKNNEIYPLTILSGGEKSRVILSLIGVMMKVSRHNLFFLIDEPNELLDPLNVDSIKQFFFKIFQKDQIVICTFLIGYRNFQPALIYEVIKGRNNMSHVFQLPNESYKLDGFIKLDEIERKIEENPENPNLRIKKFWLLYHYKMREEARNTIDESIKLFPNNINFYELKAIHGADAKERLKVYDKIAELKGSLEVGQFYNRHNELYTLGRYKEALSDINKVIEKEPDDYFAYEERAVVLAELGRFEESLEDIDKAEELKPEPVNPKAITPQSPKVRIYSLIAESHLRAQEKEKAIEAIKKAIEYDIKGFESETNSRYGDILMAFSDFEEAIEKYEKAKELPFIPVETFINLGKCLMELGQFDDALEHLKKGRNYAAHDGSRYNQGIGYQSNAELIKEAEKLIAEIDKKQKK